MPPTKFKVNQKYIEIIFNLLCEQNRQLLKLIAENEGLDYTEMANRYLMSLQQFHDWFLHTTY